MFSFFKKEESFKVVACAEGKCINITDVPDQVFSTKMMGDGFAIIPSNDTIVSPVTGEVITVFPTKHALGIKTKSGVELIVHIGIDTVNLNGEGFTALIKQNDKIKAGQPLVKLDMSVLKDKGVNLVTMVVFTAGYDKEINSEIFGKEVKAGEVLF